jgi:ketosteroid isomerase-like protein
VITGQAVAAEYLADLDPRYLAEDVVLDLVAEARLRAGRPAVAAWVHDVRHRLFTDVDHEVAGWYDAGDRVVAELTVSGRPVPARWGGTVSGRRVTARAVVVFVVRDGEISQVRVYHDTASLRRESQQSAALVALR